jgi:hypothetical protein
LAELHQTPSAAQEAARATIKAREQAIDANGVKRGRALERADIVKAAGVKAIEEISLLEQVRFEHDAKLQAFETRWEREERKHCRAHWWKGATIVGVPALVSGVALGLIAYQLAQDGSFTSAGEYGSRMVATGAAHQAASPPLRCYPGESLEDGRRCPDYPPDLEARPANGEQP